MHALRNRMMMIIGAVVVTAGYILNYMARKYQGLYRSLQYRNLKLEETIMSPEIKQALLLLIGIGILGVLGHFLIKRRSRLKEKGIALTGIVLFGGQALNSLVGDPVRNMGLYVIFWGYVLMLMSFILALYEKREQ